jgi:hypothetical protein
MGEISGIFSPLHYAHHAATPRAPPSQHKSVKQLPTTRTDLEEGWGSWRKNWPGRILPHLWLDPPVSWPGPAPPRQWGPDLWRGDIQAPVPAIPWRGGGVFLGLPWSSRVLEVPLGLATAEAVTPDPVWNLAHSGLCEYEWDIVKSLVSPWLLKVGRLLESIPPSMG